MQTLDRNQKRLLEILVARGYQADIKRLGEFNKGNMAGDLKAMGPKRGLELLERRLQESTELVNLIGSAQYVRLEN